MERVVIVEDDVESAAALRWLLEAHGYEVRCAGSVAQGVSLIRAVQPSVAILDHDLPDGSGAAVARAMRDADASEAPVFISLSGKTLDPISEALFSAVVRKPAAPDALVDAVRLAHAQWHARSR